MPVPVGRCAGIGRHYRLVGESLVEFVIDAPRVYPAVESQHRLGFHLVLPLDHVVGDAVLPRQVLLLLEKGNECRQGRLDVAPEVQLGGVAQPHLFRLEIHLNGAGLAGFGQELAVRIVGSQEHEGVASDIWWALGSEPSSPNCWEW